MAGEDRGIADTGPPAAPSPRRLRRLFLVAGLAAAALIGATCAGWLWFVATLADHEPRQPRSADAIVVLTGGASRIADAMALLDRGLGRRLLITGVHPDTTTEEIAAAARQTATLFACCVDLDRRAQNTVGNARETGRWVRRNQFRSLIVVTSAYHMPRALAELAAAVPDVQLVPYPVVPERARAHPWWTDTGTARLLFVEYVKYIVARVRLGLEAATPGGAPPAGTRQAG